MNTLSENDVHRFNLNTLRLDKELEGSKIDLLLMPSEIQKHAVVAAQWHTAMDRQVCFPRNTKIETLFGEKSIQGVAKGDVVLSHSGWKKVKQIIERKYSGKMIRIETSDRRSLIATAEHPVFEPKKGWIEMQKLRENDCLETRENNIVNIVCWQNIRVSRVFNVYNLEVEGAHTFYANGILVHNCPLCNSLQGEIIPVDSPEWGRIFPPVHLGCFLSSKIPILTSDGLKGIGDIAVGDKVLTHKNRFRRVLRLFRRENYQGLVIELTIAGIDRFIVTGEHPFLTKDGWKIAVKLDKDDSIIKLSDDQQIFEPLAIKSIAIAVVKEPKTLYNFAVEEDESYIAIGLVSHNCRCNLSYITADERGVVQRIERYKPIDPDLLAKWSSKIYTDAEIRAMAKTFKEVEPITYKGTIDSESERILRAGLRTKNEHGVAIDAKGNVIMKRPGKSPDMVTLTPDDIEKMRVGKAKNFIHNHPGASASSFSPDDLNFARTMDLDEMMVVGRKYKYTIKQGPRGWQTADLDELGKLYDSAIKATTPKYEALYKADVMMDWEEMWARQTHEAIESLSKKFELIYKRSVM